MSSLTHPISAAQLHDAAAPRIRRLRWAWPVAIVVGIPIGGYAANLIVGKVDSVGPALAGGLIAGAIIGAAQWWALRSLVPWAWIVATSVGMAAGLTAGAALVDYGISRGDLALMGAVTGLGVAGLQALLLPLARRGSGALLWVAVNVPAWALGLDRHLVRDHEERQGALRDLRGQRSARLRAPHMARPHLPVPAQRA